MNIEDFLPKYPNVYKSSYELLNPYNSEDFNQVIFKKKEFYDERQLKNVNEDIPEEKGMLMKHQNIIAKYMSTYTEYNAILLVHQMGTGKTCSAIGAIEKIKSENSYIKGALVFAKGGNLLKNFVRELRDKCTRGQYIPEGYSETSSVCGVTKRNKTKKYLTDLEVTIRTKKLYKDFYTLNTFETFAKNIMKLSDNYITQVFSNHIIVIDEVHNLRIQDDMNSTIKIYQQFFRFLHLVKNCKIILLSGTPMKDSPEEIASVMNLILPKELQFPVGEKFMSEYLIKKGDNNYVVKKDKIKDLKKRFKGRVSFIKSIKSDIKLTFQGEKNVGNLKHLTVFPLKMSDKQNKSYLDALELDKKGSSGINYNARQASMIVFPDGTYGQPRIPGTNAIDKTKGFSKYVTVKTKTKKSQIIKTYKLSNEFQDYIKGDTKSDVISKLPIDSKKYKKVVKTRLKNLKKLSIKYASTIESILNADKKLCFVYSELITGSGSIVFSKLLELFGFSLATGNEGDTKGLRYSLLTSDVSNKKIQKIISCSNQRSNIHGDIIKVIIGSKVISEGVSFYNIQKEYILTPWYNYSETDQAIARGYRLNSHRYLLEAGEKPTIDVYQYVSIPVDNVKSIDLNMYEISENKDISIKRIIRYLMESAIDCSLNYYRNYIKNYDGKRECEYQKCKFKCDDIDMKLVKRGVDTDMLDLSTYRLYYSSSPNLPIHRELFNLFSKYNELKLENIIEYLNKDYTETEIKNALKILINRSNSDILKYKNYIDIYYTRYIINTIIMKLLDIFKNVFKMHLDSINDLLSEYDEFNVISALNTIISENIIIKNKYGFTSYLKEYKNIYFLVTNITMNYDIFSSYYSHFPNIINKNTFNMIVNDITNDNIDNIINKICKIKNKSDFSKLIKSMSEEVQELFIESAIESKVKNITVITDIRKLVLEYFSGYINNIKDIWMSTLLKDSGILRCYNKNTDTWDVCTTEYENMFTEYNKNLKNILEDNKWGYYGKFNPETNVFSIVNISAQKEAIEKDYKKNLNKLEKLLKSGKITEDELKEEMKAYEKDYRRIFPGKNCMAGWSIADLLKIIIKDLQIEIPDIFMKNVNEKTLRKLVLGNKYIGDSDKNKHLYSKNDVNNLSVNDLRRILYWSDKNHGGNKKDLCKSIKNWFENTKWKGVSMLIPDKEVGITGGHTKKLVKKQDKKITVHTKIVKPSTDNKFFKDNIKEIRKIYKDCKGIDRYKPEIDDKIWVFIFSRKKMIGFIIIKKSNIIHDICILSTYTRRKLSKLAIEDSLKSISNNSKSYIINVVNASKNYNKFIKTLNKYGFDVVKDDGKNTILKFKIS